RVRRDPRALPREVWLRRRRDLPAPARRESRPVAQRVRNIRHIIALTKTNEGRAGVLPTVETQSPASLTGNATLAVSLRTASRERMVKGTRGYGASPCRGCRCEKFAPASWGCSGGWPVSGACPALGVSGARRRIQRDGLLLLWDVY